MPLYDIRAPASPLLVLKGHTRAKQTRMNRPTFCQQGRGIAVVGEQSDSITTYCARSGDVSTGYVGYHMAAGTSLLSLPLAAGGETLAVAAQKMLGLFRSRGAAASQ